MTTVNPTNKREHEPANPPKAGRHRTRTVLLALLGLVIALGTTGWVLQSRSAAQGLPGQETVSLPVYESTLSNASADPATETTSTAVEPSAVAADATEATENSTAEIVTDAAESVDTDLSLLESTAAASEAAASTGTALALSANTTAAPTNYTQRAIVRAGGTALLTMPNGEQIATLTTGAALQATGRTQDGEWVQVDAADGSSGWIAADQILLLNGNLLPVATATDVEQAAAGSTLVNAPEDAATNPVAAADADTMMATIVLNGARLNVRSGPGTEYAIVGKAHDGEEYRVVGRNGDSSWVQIDVPGAPETSAWVSTMFVALDGTAADLPISEEYGTLDTASASVAASVLTPVTTQSALSTNAAPATQQTVATGTAKTGLSGNLVFQSGNGGPIHVYNLDTGNVRMLTTGHDPVVSPDGQTVAFTRYGGEAGLYLIGIDGSNERRIFSGRELVSAPSWSADGEWVLFSHLIGGFACRDLGFSICLPDNPFLNDYDLIEKPAWGLARVNRNGDEYRDIPALNTAYAADWSNGGIVYQATTGIEITYDSADYEGYALFNQKVGYEDPTWQPGGGRIVFQEKGATHTELWSANPDGSGLVALTRPETTLVDQLPSNVAPAWSPDGGQIVYLSNRAADEEAGAWRLWVMGADGSNKRPLPIDVAIDYTFGREQVVSWGPQV